MFLFFIHNSLFHQFFQIWYILIAFIIKINDEHLSPKLCVNKNNQSASPLLLQSFDVIDPHAENEEVVLSSFLGHLYVGAVHSTDGERTVQHELHVSSA